MLIVLVALALCRIAITEARVMLAEPVIQLALETQKAGVTLPINTDLVLKKLNEIRSQHSTKELVWNADYARKSLQAASSIGCSNPHEAGNSYYGAAAANVPIRQGNRPNGDIAVLLAASIWEAQGDSYRQLKGSHAVSSLADESYAAVGCGAAVCAKPIAGVTDGPSVSVVCTFLPEHRPAKTASSNESSL